MVSETSQNATSDSIERVKRFADGAALIARRRTMQITVERSGDLVLCAPPKVDDAALRRFVREKRFWIYTKLAEKDRLQKRVPLKEFVGGEGFLYLGRSHRLKIVSRQDVPLKLAGRRALLPASWRYPDRARPLHPLVHRTGHSMAFEPRRGLPFADGN